MTEKRHNKIVKINPQTFSIKMMYDILLDFLQDGEDGWEVVRNKPWPYGAVLKVPNWKDGEYGYAGIMYGQIKGKGKKHSYTVNKSTSYGKWINESENLKKIAYNIVLPSYSEDYKKDWRFNNEKIQEWITKERSTTTKRYNFSYGNGTLVDSVLAGSSTAIVVMSISTGTVNKGTYITVGDQEVVVTKDTSSYIHTYTKPKTDSAGKIMVDNDGNTIMDTITENRIDIEFSPALEADYPKGTEVKLPSDDKRYITFLTEQHKAATGYYKIREAEHFYTDADVIWFSMFKQYEPSFDWNELMENTRKNPCAKRLGWSWYSSPYPTWEKEAPIYPGEGCPVIASDPKKFSSQSWDGANTGGSQGIVEIKTHVSPIIQWDRKNEGKLLPPGSFILGPNSALTIDNVYVVRFSMSIGTYNNEFENSLKKGYINPLKNEFCTTIEELIEQFKNGSQRTPILFDALSNCYYSGHKPFLYFTESMASEQDFILHEFLSTAIAYKIEEGEYYNTTLTPCNFIEYLCGDYGQIFVAKQNEIVHYYYKNSIMLSNTSFWPWDNGDSITMAEAIEKKYLIEIDFSKAVDLEFKKFSLTNTSTLKIPLGLYRFPTQKDKYLIVYPAFNNFGETEIEISLSQLAFDSKNIELIIEDVWKEYKDSYSIQMLVFYKDYNNNSSENNPSNPTDPPNHPSVSNSILPEYVYLYMSKTKHNANIAVNYRDWWDMAQVGFFEPFASDYEYQFPAFTMSSNIGVRPCNHLVNYSGMPYPYDNMLFDYTQGNRSWGHSMIGYSATWWDGTQEFLDKHACSQTQAMLPSGKWESFFNYAIRSNYWYSYTDSGHYSHGFKEPEKVDSRYFITNTMTPNVEENFGVIPYGIETSGYPFDMTSLDLEIARQNKQSYSLLPFYLGVNIEDNNEQNMICAVPAMYAVSRPVTRYGLYRNPTDNDDLFLIMPNCWEGRPWHYQQDATRLYTNKNKTENEQQEEYDKYRDWGKNMNVAMHIGTNTSFEQIEDYVGKTKEFD